MGSKAWYFVPGADAIKVIRLVKPLTEYLHCTTLDAQCFQPDAHTQYAVYYDDNGMYANAAFNKVAHDVLSKIHIWWGTYNGWFMVVKNVYDAKGRETQEDMDVTVADFIKICNSTIKS